MIKCLVCGVAFVGFGAYLDHLITVVDSKEPIVDCPQRGKR